MITIWIVMSTSLLKTLLIFCLFAKYEAKSITNDELSKSLFNNEFIGNDVDIGFDRNATKSHLYLTRKRAFGGGMDVDGQVLYVCRVQVHNQTIPGKFSTKLNKCCVTHNNKEVQYNKFQLLVESKFGSYKWSPMRRPVTKLPINIVLGGLGSGGQFYYIGQCRVRSREMKRISEQIGMIHYDGLAKEWVATVPFRGHQILCFDYSVLVIM